MPKPAEIERLRIENKLLTDTLEATRSRARALEEKVGALEQQLAEIRDVSPATASEMEWLRRGRAEAEKRAQAAEIELEKLLDKGLDIITALMRGEVPNAEQREQLRGLLHHYDPENPAFAPADTRTLWQQLEDTG